VYGEQGFVVLAVDIAEDRDSVQAYMEEQGLTFSNLLDETGMVARGYNVSGIPASYFITRDGIIHATHIGPLDDATIERYLKEIL
jgi:cytochrome c biogenesis protein CcmG, thiol:disulfide interchange protein DsbE